MRDDEIQNLNLKDVDFDKVLNTINDNSNNKIPSFLKKSSEIDTAPNTSISNGQRGYQTTNKINIPKQNLIEYIDNKLNQIKRDIEYYDKLFKNYRDLNKSNKDKLLSMTDEEKLIIYQEELILVKELIIENSFLVPVIKAIKEDIIKLISLSGLILTGTNYNVENIKKNLDEYIKIYSNHAYQGNQISILIREIHKLDKKNLEDMTNIDFVTG